MIQVAPLISEEHCVGKKAASDSNLILIRNSINPTETVSWLQLPQDQKTNPVLVDFVLEMLSFHLRLLQILSQKTGTS